MNVEPLSEEDVVIRFANAQGDSGKGWSDKKLKELFADLKRTKTFSINTSEVNDWSNMEGYKAKDMVEWSEIEKRFGPLIQK